MLSDLEMITEHVVQIVFHHSIVQVHVVINSQGRLIGAWILEIHARTTSFKYPSIQAMGSNRLIDYIIHDIHVRYNNSEC
jgi:hypothetical protein